MATEPVLTLHDRQSAVWQKLTKHLDEQLASLRKRNDATMSHDKTCELRGAIRTVKALQSLGTDKPVPPADEENFKD